ncbi:MAG: hypothetical protein AAB676_14105 [Verrucomicrobiota bacterium]
MNATDHDLKRLLQAAADTPPPAATEPSSTHKARTLAHWRAARAQPAWFEWMPLFRRGLTFACAAGVLLAVFSFTQIKPATLDAWDVASRVANATYAP